MTDERLTLKAGPAGWVMASGATLETCFVRFALIDNEWQPTTLFRSALPAELVRSIPLRRICVAVNADARISATLTDLYDAPTAEPGSPDFYRTFDGYGHVPVDPIVLKRPAGRRLSDEWYEQVSDAYVLAAAQGLKPRTTIAEAAGVSLDVAGRWIYEARKRGLLPPTEPGRVRARPKEENRA